MPMPLPTPGSTGRKPLNLTSSLLTCLVSKSISIPFCFFFFKYNCLNFFLQRLTSECVWISISIASLKKEEVKIELQDKSTLRISGERHREEVKEADQWHRVERSSGRFMRQFRLPENVNVDGISAKLENGVLSVNVPKIKPDSASNFNGDVKSIDIATDYK
eukprot:Gb_27342 [translate_table: standard]